MQKKRVVIVGGGFGGVAAAKSISKLDEVEITLVDRRNFHLFQPLLYQVAMAGLNPADIAVPLRSLFRHRKNIQHLLAEVEHLDLTHQRIGFEGRWIDYDYLILSCGAKHSYFGQNQWEDVAPGLKNIEQALEIRRRVLMAFELAEKAQTSEELEHNLTFVIVGGGPTGVELAGGIAELASQTLKKDFRKADLSRTKVILIEAGSRVLSAFPEELSKKAEKSLQNLGVHVLLNARASDLSASGLRVGEKVIRARTLIWAAGVLPSSLTSQLPGEKDRQGRAVVGSDLSLADFRNVFVIGDQAAVLDQKGFPLPGIAPVAIQQGHFLGKVLNSDLAGRPRPHFHYFNKGMMATIGRSQAVVSTGGWQFSGFVAWLMWVFIHILYLARFKNRLFVFFQWAWAYFTFGRGARLITHKTWRFYSGEKIDLK